MSSNDEDFADTKEPQSEPPSYEQPPPQPPGKEISYFDDRLGNYTFVPRTDVYGYLPQVNQWAQQTKKPFVWHVIRTGGKDHIPEFEATPECQYF